MEHRRLSDIHAFICVAKTGSFTAAASVLGLSRSAVGKCVVRLEAHLSTRLLQRTTRTLSLTDDGRAAFERWCQILDDIEDVEATLASRRSQPVGTLKFSAPVAFGQRRVLPVLDAFLKRWPQLRTDATFTDRFVDIVEEGFDLAVRIGAPKEDARLLTRTIAWQRFATCASPSYLQARGTPETPEALAEHERITFMNGGKTIAWRFQVGQAPLLYEEPGRVNMDDAEAMRRAALAGLGILHLPTYIVGDDLRAGTLVQVLAPYCPPADPIRVIYPSKRHLSPRIRAFVDLLVEQLQD